LCSWGNFTTKNAELIALYHESYATDFREKQAHNNSYSTITPFKPLLTFERNMGYSFKVTSSLKASLQSKQMKRSDFHAPQAGRVIRMPTGYLAFIPAPLPLAITCTPEIVLALLQANAALSAKEIDF
jgi:hypothetical protein